MDFFYPLFFPFHGWTYMSFPGLPWMRRLRSQNVPYVSVNLEPVFGDIDANVTRERSR